MARHFGLLAAAALVTIVAGCGRESDGPGTGSGTASLPTAATLGDQQVLTVGEYLAAEPYASADRSRGERQAQICKACHSLDRGGPNTIGPVLYGFFGTEAGSQGDFEYSAALRDADFVWTPDALNAWLAQPGQFLPGNRMVFAGVLRQSDRDALIAYLLDVTASADQDGKKD
ncbi:MAG: cytochrome c family protein [Proteobacteria bacterium]|nr:cytochrome c family protein [Pseudomonadota bacterium]